MKEPAIPRTIEDITVDWVNDVLIRAGKATGPAVLGVERVVIGEERGFLSQVVRVNLIHDAPPGEAPSSIIVKIEPVNEAFRESVKQRSSFEREIAFYGDVAPQVPISVPRIYHGAISDRAGVLVMEDLGHLTPGDQVRGVEHERVEAAVRNIARLHGAYWGNDALDALAWLPDHEHFHNAGIEQAWAAFSEAYGLRIGAAGRRLGAWAAENLDWLCQELTARPQTLIHGDLRADNLLFGAAGTGPDVMIIDWQGANKGLALIDVARLLGGSEPVAERSGRQMEIFEAWYEALGEAGVTGYPADEALNDLRIAAIYCLLIPVKLHQLTGGATKGRTGRLVDALTERHYASAIELEAERALP